MRLRLALLTAVLLAACATAPLDRATKRGMPRRGVELSEVPVRGYTVDVKGPEFDRFSGELIAVTPGYVYVLTELGEARAQALREVPRGSIEVVRVKVRPSRAAGTGVWTSLGFLSTASHGFYLILTGPAWLAVGIPASILEAGASRARARPDQLDLLYQYARFPQGLPPNWVRGSAPVTSADGPGPAASRPGAAPASTPPLGPAPPQPSNKPSSPAAPTPENAEPPGEQGAGMTL